MGLSKAGWQKAMGVVLVVAVSLLCSAGGAYAQTRLSIGTGGTGGVYYPLGGGMAEIINKYVPGVTATAEVTGASIENSRRVGVGQMDFGIGNADTIYFAHQGMPPFNQAFNLRAVATLYPSTMQIAVLEGSGIESVGDLHGKRVSVGPPGGATRVMSENILAEYGLLDSVEKVDLSFTESVDAMKDRNLDAAFVLAGVPASALIDLSSTDEVVFLPIEPDHVATLLQRFPYYSAQTIKAGAYRGQDDAVSTIGVQNVLFTNATLDVNLVYEVTRAIMNHLNILVSIHNIASLISLDDAPSTPIPLHPGAEKFYLESGALD